MAMGIIAKDKKQIKWLGIPSDLQQRQPNQETRVQELQKQVEQEEVKKKTSINCICCHVIALIVLFFL